MAVVDVVALLIGVAGAVARPWRLPAWAFPVVAAAVVVVAGGIPPAAALRAVGPLRDPVAFLLAAVPLAVLLDRLGWFELVAGRLAGDGRATGGLWILAATVTTVLNLDASVVLLTPLYVSLARRRGTDPLRLAVIPVLLACLASAALPVANLTNLIARSQTGASTGDFLAALGLPSLVATTTGWFAYRRWASTRPVQGAPSSGASPPLPPGAPPGGSRRSERRILATGGAVIAAVLVGFTAGEAVGLQPWEVAVAADVVLLLLVRAVPWRAVPAGTALVAAGLGVLAAAAASHLPVGSLLAGGGLLDQARVTGASALAANVADNLPALLVALPALGTRPSPALWSVLIGVDMGPVLLVTGSLASLLWLDALGRLGVAVRARHFTAVGARVGLPAAVAGAVTHIGLHAAGLG